MYWAARQGHTDAIQYLWEQKAKVNTHNKVKGPRVSLLIFAAVD